MNSRDVTNAVLGEKLDALSTDVRELREHIIGDADTPGLRMRVDRLEQAHRQLVWWKRTIITSAVGAIICGIGGAIAAAWHYIAGNSQHTP